MTHLIFDEDGDFVDTINFDSLNQISAYMIENPSHTVKMITDECIDVCSFEDDDEDDDLYIDDDNAEW